GAFHHGHTDRHGSHRGNSPEGSGPQEDDPEQRLLHSAPELPDRARRPQSLSASALPSSSPPPRFPVGSSPSDNASSSATGRGGKGQPIGPFVTLWPICRSTPDWWTDVVVASLGSRRCPMTSRRCRTRAEQREIRSLTLSGERRAHDPDDRIPVGRRCLLV